MWRVWALPRSLAATWGITVCFLFLQVLRWFSSLGVPSAPYEFRCGWRVVERVGLPHSAIRGSRDVCSTPRLLAAYHGLLRTVAPRHPPWTLSRLTIFSLSHGIPVGFARAPRPQACGSRVPRFVPPVPTERDSTLRSSSFPRVVKDLRYRSTAASTIADTVTLAAFLPGKLLPFTVLHGLFPHDEHESCLLWRYGDLNPRPMACKATALATELYPRALQPPSADGVLAERVLAYGALAERLPVRHLYRKGRRV